MVRQIKRGYIHSASSSLRRGDKWRGEGEGRRDDIKKREVLGVCVCVWGEDAKVRMWRREEKGKRDREKRRADAPKKQKRGTVRQLGVLLYTERGERERERERER